ncbi:MAG: hypothetical protein U5L06_14915 [Rhodovibrio sp.]|nr:hypothetical protein [Rhodovibrio sp.]
MTLVNGNLDQGTVEFGRARSSSATHAWPCRSPATTVGLPTFWACSQFPGRQLNRIKDQALAVLFKLSEKFRLDVT